MHLQEKKAEFVSKNVDDLISILKTYQGELRDSKTPVQNIAKDLIYGGGSRGKLLSKFPDIKKSFADLDVKAGKKIYDAAKNSKHSIIQKISPSMVQKYTIPLKKSFEGIPDKAIEVGVPMLSAPINKVKKAVLPTVGAIAVGSYLAKRLPKNNQNRGDDGVISNNKKEEAQKIATVICGEQPDLSNTHKTSQQEYALEIEKIADFCLHGSKQLKEASAISKQLIDENLRLNKEVERLNKEAEYRVKNERAEKLASLMNHKGLISKSKVESKAREILGFSDESYEILKTAVEELPIFSESEKNGLDNLTFLSKDININGEEVGEKQSFASIIANTKI